MEKSVKIIGKNKWISLSPRQKHRAIAKFAIFCINNKEVDDFFHHYNRLIEWAPIDRFYRPDWIGKEESLELFFAFHQKLSGQPIHYFKPNKDEETNLIWTPKKDISILLDQVLTPYNVGSILRLIDNFGFSELIHSTKGLNISNSNLKRAAMGTDQWIPIKYVSDLPNFIENSKTPVIGLEKADNSIPIMEWKTPDKPFNLIIGNEAYGISKNIIDICSECVHIPMAGYKNSMNLSHAFAVISFYISTKN